MNDISQHPALRIPIDEIFEHFSDHQQMFIYSAKNEFVQLELKSKEKLPYDKVVSDFKKIYPTLIFRKKLS